MHPGTITHGGSITALRQRALAHALVQQGKLPWWRGCAPLVVLPAATWWACTTLAAPRWILMWSFAYAVYLGCKWLTWRRTPVAGVPMWRHVAYLLGWPGMDAQAFLGARETRVANPTGGEWLFAVAKTAVGIATLAIVARFVPTAHPLVVGWIGLVGLALAIHCGAFHLLSCCYRQIGIDAKPLMNWPIVATSQSEFWGRRWNTAFRDLCHRFVFRPLNRRVGVRWGTIAGFAVSGVAHDLVISLPAGGGYGGPTIYFLIQGGALLFERGRSGRALRLGSGARGWLFTAATVAGPAFILFHPLFIERVILPMLGAWRAMS